MATEGNEKEQEAEGSERPLAMHDQGPTYSSSYNESTPGEIEENRRYSLREQEAEGKAGAGGSEL